MTTLWIRLGESVDALAWRPLEYLAELASLDPELPPVVPDDFLYSATITNPGQADIHVYRHLLSQRRLYVDTDGVLWRYAPAGGRDAYVRIDLAEALERAELSRGELLAARTRPGPRRPGWTPPPMADASSLPDSDRGPVPPWDTTAARSTDSGSADVRTPATPAPGYTFGLGVPPAPDASPTAPADPRTAPAEATTEAGA